MTNYLYEYWCSDRCSEYILCCFLSSPEAPVSDLLQAPKQVLVIVVFLQS